jgi:hypothetical protein
MTIIDNTTFKTWVNSQGATRDATFIKLQEVTGLTIGTIKNIYYGAPTSARNFKQINEAISRGEI